jgi:hypothetical protein
VIGIVLLLALVLLLPGILYVWASSLAEDSTGGELEIYMWDDRDAYGDDALVEIAMSSGDGLNWAVIKITISIDGGTPQACSEGTNSGSSCEYEPYQGTGNDQRWEVAEGIIISGDCYDNWGCNVDVTITKMGVGSEDDKVVGQVAAYADMTS